LLICSSQMQKVSSIEQLRPRASQERAGSQVCEFIIHFQTKRTPTFSEYLHILELLIHYMRKFVL
jgi:hypothetical protein